MIFIPFNVPSLKNSKTATTIGKGPNKRTTLVHSPAVRKYLQKLGVKKYRTRLSKKQKEAGLQMVENYATRPNLFRKSVGNYFDDTQVPVVVKFFFIRDSKRKFDFVNAVQIVCDLLVAHEYIVDDCMDYFIPIPWCMADKFFNKVWYVVNKDNPGVWLEIVGD